jgi:hypothetical protein
VGNVSCSDLGAWWTPSQLQPLPRLERLRCMYAIASCTRSCSDLRRGPRGSLFIGGGHLYDRYTSQMWRWLRDMRSADARNCEHRMRCSLRSFDEGCPALIAVPLMKRNSPIQRGVGLLSIFLLTHLPIALCINYTSNPLCYREVSRDWGSLRFAMHEIANFRLLLRDPAGSLEFLRAYFS